jgi:penicillin-binding protein 1A
MRIRAALARSKNLVTVRVLQAIGPQYAQDYIGRFGFDPKLHPAYLTMGLGAGSATPLQMVAAYAVFANGGYRISPYMIARHRRFEGQCALRSGAPVVAGENAERAIDPRNAWIMTVAAARCDSRRNRDARARAEPQRSFGQDRHDQ